MKYDYIEFQDRSQPLGFLITVRCYGTWLHGDERGSMNRRSYNKIGGPKVPVSKYLEHSDQSFQKGRPFLFGPTERVVVEATIQEVCMTRGYSLIAMNVRTNHAHTVIAASCSPEAIMNGIKAYSTRRLREKGLAGPTDKVWSRHGSTRYLWTEEHIGAAVDYVLNGQGEELPRFD